MIRRLTPTDIPEGMRLKNAEGWNQLEADWRLCLEIAPAGCLAAVRDGLVAGTGAAIPYDGRIAWIGLILVDARFRRSGLATALMRELLGTLAPGVTAKLDASPAGQPVYEKLGFVAEYGMTRMICPAAPALPNDRPGAQHLAEPEFTRAAQQDAEAFGVPRPPLLRRLYARTPQAAWSARGSFCLGRPGWHSFQVGPVVAESFEAARTVVTAALQALPGQSVVMDLPDAQREMRDWLASLGFVQQRRFVRMFRGANLPGQPSQYFAACGPEFG